MNHFGYFYIVISSLSFAFIGIFSKNLYEANTSLSVILITRFIISIFVLIPFIKFSKRNFILYKKDIIMGGGLYFITTFTYLSSLQYIGVGLAAVLAYIFPVYIFIYSIITGEIKLNLKSLLLILSSLTGVILISFHKFGKIDNLIGIFFAILSGLIYAVYIIINKDKKQNKNQIDIVFYQLIGASFLSIPYLFISEKNFNLNYNFIFNMLGISIIGTLSAIYFLIKGMEKIGAFKSSIISLTEPVFAVMISVLFLNEKITILQLYGLILIIISCIFSSSIKNNLSQKMK